VPKPTRVSGRDGSQESADPERSLGVSGAAVETVAKRPRRLFSAADKLRLVKEADACLASGERGALEALLRREGIYSSQLSSWRTQLGAHGAAGLTAKMAVMPIVSNNPQIAIDAFERHDLLIPGQAMALDDVARHLWPCPT